MDDVLSHRMRRILDGQTLPRYVFENLARRVDAWSPVDNPDGYIALSYRVTTEALDQARIPHLPSEAGFFLLIDLRGWLPEPTWAAEDALWRQILEETKVNLTPGSTCRIVEPGFFRLCFAAEPPEAVEAAVRRIAELLRSRMP